MALVSYWDNMERLINEIKNLENLVQKEELKERLEEYLSDIIEFTQDELDKLKEG